MSRADRRRLERIYRQIPTFECVPGCTDCCGPVVVARAELERLPKLENAMERMVQTDCGQCPYERPGFGCTAYDDRPFMCRLFGTTIEEPKLTCPHGRHPQKPISAAKARKLTQDYLAIIKEDHERARAVTRDLEWLAFWREGGT